MNGAASSTYRLQLHAGFTFEDASAIVGYLHDLGIGAAYTSPILAAAAGSTHGYDVIDHTRLNPELDVADFETFTQALRQRDMGYVLDIVPNHMGIDSNDNPQWNQLLAEGRDGLAGRFFDLTGNDPILLPVLGQPYDKALEAGEIRLVREDDRVQVAYFDKRFAANVPAGIDLDQTNANPASLTAVLSGQHYELAFWKDANERLNYRRFFDVTTLAAMAMERQDVFDHAHGLIFRLISEGKISGLRLDHPDGLRDPKGYFDRLQEKIGSDDRFYVVAEKILAIDEPLRADWNVAGTSGYDFLTYVNSFFVDPSAEPTMTSLYGEFAGTRPDFPATVVESKLHILDAVLISELNGVSRELCRVAGDRFSPAVLRNAIRETVAHFDLYRTYVTEHGIAEADRQAVKRAVEKASVHAPELPAEVWPLLSDALLNVKDVRFAQKFQQLTAPVTAKGVEDTAFYRYHRLISLNEVGGDPGQFGLTADALHRYLADRQTSWPGAMSTLSTHDTKRSEDVRARLNALSLLPDQWATAVRQWHELVQRIEPGVDANDAYLLYQTLLGAWPTGLMEGFAERVKAYMTKALREGKERTNWIAPDEKYERSVHTLIDHLVEGEQGAAFREVFQPFQDRISRVGRLNSLAQSVLKLWAPGVPDTYQGTELLDFSLVDPDNRRPVDYAKRAKLLAGLGRNAPAVDASGAAKLFVHQRSLVWRREHAGWLHEAAYVPLRVLGPAAEHVFAFAREHRGGRVFVVVSRNADELDPNKRAETYVEFPDRVDVRSLFGDESARFGTAEPLAATLGATLGRFPVGVWMERDLSGET